MNGAGAPDFFYREAQRLGYVARSAVKLLQMQKKYKLIKPGSSVLDLDCAPGAWLQVACQSLGPLKTGGIVVGIDLKNRRDAALSVELGMQALDLAVGRATLHSLDDNVQKEKEMDGSASDLENDGVLLTGGHLVIKLLESEDVKEFSEICKPLFRKASWLRPKATRSSS